jgi:hypothetical protein
MTWARTGGGPPLQARYDALVQQMSALGAAAIVPRSEEACDAMAAFVQANAKRPPEPTPSLLSARNAFREAVERYVRVRASIVILQAQLKRAARSPAHKILGDISAEMLLEPPHAREMLFDYGVNQSDGFLMPEGWTVPDFTDGIQARAAAGKVVARTMELEAFDASLRGAIEFERGDTETQNRTLIFHVAEQLGAIKGQLSSVLAEMDEIRRQLPAIVASATSKKGRKHG